MYSKKVEYERLRNNPKFYFCGGEERVKTSGDCGGLGMISRVKEGSVTSSGRGERVESIALFLIANCLLSSHSMRRRMLTALLAPVRFTSQILNST